MFTVTLVSRPKLAPMLKSTPAKNGTGPIIKVWVKAALKASVAPASPSMVSLCSFELYTPCTDTKGFTLAPKLPSILGSVVVLTPRYAPALASSLSAVLFAANSFFAFSMSCVSSLFQLVSLLE